MKAKSKEYILRVKKLFVEKGIQLLDVSHMALDESFTFLSNASVYAPSGGGFSELIAAVVEKNGGLALTAASS